jgi:hypothetical protein
MTIQITRIAGDVMKVNAYLIHGPSGVTIVDGMLTVSDASKVRAMLDASGAEVAGSGDHPPPS